MVRTIRSTIVEALGEMGVFVRMIKGLADAGAEPETLIIDATYLKAHRTASSLRVKKGILAA